MAAAGAAAVFDDGRVGAAAAASRGAGGRVGVAGVRAGVADAG